MTPLPPGELCKGEEQTMKDWLERQRTVRNETTKDKAGTLPPAVYSNANPKATTRVFFPDDQVEQTPTASSEMRSVVSDVSVLSFVSDATAPQLTLTSTVAADFNQVLDRSTRPIRMTVTMMLILSRKNWLLNILVTQVTCTRICRS